MQYYDLDVYKKVGELAMEIHRLTMKFPKFEMYELGSQMRRASNSCPANLAEAFGNKHTNIYLEGISRAQGELRETQHHLLMAYKKEYLNKKEYDDFINRYGECSKMLYGLEKSLETSRRN